MLHTKLLSPTKKLLFSEVSEQGKADEKLTLTEETKKALEARTSLQDTQKKEINDFLKSISLSDGSIPQNLTTEQQSTLNFLLEAINVQKKENKSLDSKMIADKVAIIGQTKEALDGEKTPRKITAVRKKEEIQAIEDLLKKIPTSGEKQDFSKLTPQERDLLLGLHKDLRPYFLFDKDTNPNGRLEVSYGAIKIALKELDAPAEVKPEVKPEFSIDELRKGDMKEVLIKKDLKSHETNEFQRALITGIQKKLIELGYQDTILETDFGSFGGATKTAISKFTTTGLEDITRGLAIKILTSTTRAQPQKEVIPKAKPTPEVTPVPAPEAEKKDTVLATKLEKGAEKIPNEDVLKVQKLLKLLDKDYQGGEDGLFGDKTEESLKRVLKVYFKDETTDAKIITKSLIEKLELEGKKRSEYSDKKPLSPKKDQPQPLSPSRVSPLPRPKPTDVSSRKQETLSPSGVDSSSLVPERNFFEKIFNFSEDLETSKFNNLRGKIESTISAKSGLETLEKQIFTISNTLDKNKIESVYTLAQQELGKKGIQLDSSLSPIEKAYILQLVANALMGGKSMVERREKNKTNIKDYIQADRSQAVDADKLFAQTFSGTMVKDISAARNLAYQELSKIGTYKEMFLNNESGTYIFSVRSKVGINGLQGYAAGSGEIVDIGVPYVRVTEFEKRDVQKLISALNPVQLTLLRQQLKPLYGKLNDAQIISLLVSGEKVGPQFVVKTPQGNITLELTFNKGGNCFNDAIGVHVELPVVVYNYDRKGGGDGGNGHANGGQGSNPGVRGGGTGGGGNGGPGSGGGGR